MMVTDQSVNVDQDARKALTFGCVDKVVAWGSVRQGQGPFL